MPRQRSGYAHSAQVRRVIQLARAHGIDVAALRVGNDGSVTVYDCRAAAAEPTDTAADRALRAWQAVQDEPKR